MPKNKSLSYIHVFVFILMTAFSIIYIHNISVIIPVDLMIFLMTLYIIIFFHLLRIKTFKKTYISLKTDKFSYVSAMFFLCLLWLGTFIISSYYSPVIYIISATAWSATFSSFYLFIKNKSKLQLLRGSMLLALIATMYIALYRDFTFNRYILMLLLTFTSGVGMYGYLFYSHKLHNIGLTTIDILMVRFWPLFLISFVVVIFNHSWSHINGNVLFDMIVLTVCTVLPVYFSQKSVECIGAEQTSLFIAITPLVTFILEKFLTNIAILDTGYISVLLGAIIIGFGLYSKFIMTKSNQ